jgi:hypothetical protein
VCYKAINDYFRELLKGWFVAIKKILLVWVLMKQIKRWSPGGQVVSVLSPIVRVQFPAMAECLSDQEVLCGKPRF